MAPCRGHNITSAYKDHQLPNEGRKVKLVHTQTIALIIGEIHAYYPGTTTALVSFYPFGVPQRGLQLSVACFYVASKLLLSPPDKLKQIRCRIQSTDFDEKYISAGIM
jgi:hypothetical protein